MGTHRSERGRHVKIIGGLLAVTVTLLSVALPFVLPGTACAADIEHLVQADDNLHLLAAYYYGNPRRWKDIYEANPGIAGQPNMIPGGTVVIIPEKDLRTFPMEYDEWKAKVNR